MDNDSPFRWEKRTVIVSIDKDGKTLTGREEKVLQYRTMEKFRDDIFSTLHPNPGDKWSEWKDVPEETACAES